MSPKRVLIIGGGITGLAAAFYLQKKSRALGLPISIRLLESGSCLGGKIRTQSLQGFLIEEGPDSFVTLKPWALELCRDLGLWESLLPTKKPRGDVCIYNRGRLRPLPKEMNAFIPSGIASLMQSNLLTTKAKLEMLPRLFRSAIFPSSPRRDRPISQVVLETLGREVLERIVQPLVAGIYAGEPEQMSFKSCFPISPSNSRLPSPTLFMSLKAGLGELVQALFSTFPPGAILLNSKVKEIRLARGGYEIQLQSAPPLQAESVLVTIPAPSASVVLEEFSPALAATLNDIPFVSTATLSLAYRREDVQHPLDGFGFLVPREEGCLILGSSWTSSKFPERAPDGYVLIRCFVGGSGKEGSLDEEDGPLIGKIQKEVSGILGIWGEPALSHFSRWRQANPQYTVGHEKRLEKIDSELSSSPGLFLAGSSYRGVGIPDCIYSGRQSAEKIVEYIRANSN